MEKSLDEKNAFWKIEDLLPVAARPRVPAGRDTGAVDVRSGAPVKGADEPPADERLITARETDIYPQDPDEEYMPADSLISAVRIFHRRTNERYYEQFRRAAVRYAEKEGEEVPFAEFFSYMPQYSQMNEAQSAYYFYWRTAFRHGEKPAASLSYLLLYVYEQINLAPASPSSAQENLMRLWRLYGDEHPRLATLVREWVCDLSLLYRLPPPAIHVSEYRKMLGDFRLKEFFIPAESRDRTLSAAVLLFCNNYDYTKSKFYTKETKADFDRVLVGATKVALGFLRDEGKGLLTGENGISKMTRETFAGAVCAYPLKAKIEVRYTSFSATHELRYIMTDVLKYAENALRGALGIRSKLTVYAVTRPLAACLDAYLARVLPEKKPRAKAKTKSEAAYESRYTMPARAPSFARAAEIEALSWGTTEKLTTAFEETDASEKPQREVETASVPADHDLPASKQIEAETVCENGGFREKIKPFLPFLIAALHVDREEQRAVARAQGVMPDVLADAINTVAEDALGDILLEETNGTYHIIGEYIEILESEGLL